MAKTQFTVSSTRKKSGIAFIILGIAFLIWAIIGRYVVLPGFMESLESGVSRSGTIPEGVATWKIARYLIWAFSFKLGILFVTIGALLQTNMKRLKLALYIIGGLLYISLAYAPIPGPALLFGIGGVLMMIFILITILRLSKARDQNIKSSASDIDLRLAGYFFFAMATYTLCGLLGVRGSALNPEKMIEYGLQADAASFAAHALIELVLGWLFLLLSYRQPQI
ncbi:MAG: hypothetical protein JNM55_18735 [Anaerolineales bacterium]|nr:hypothetical protein [Anaerolineales bacterium]